MQPNDAQTLAPDSGDPDETIAVVQSGSSGLLQTGHHLVGKSVLCPHALAIMRKDHHVAHLWYVRHLAPAAATEHVNFHSSVREPAGGWDRNQDGR